MAQEWTWTYAGADGQPVAGEGLTTVAFPTQADAEAWFSQEWAELADAGVASVTLWCDGAEVYGPMSLEPPA